MSAAIQYVFGNFFETELTVGLTAAGTTILVPPSMSAALPVINTPNTQAQLVLWDGVLPPEIVACTANPQTGALTVVRAQEGTTAQAWGAGAQIRCALTAQVINSALSATFNIQQILQSSFLPLTGGTLTGPLTLNADPTTSLGAATKQYVDNVQGNKLPLAGGTMQGTINMNNNRIVSLPVPVSTAEPARLQEVNNEATTRLNFNLDASGQLLTAGSGSAYTLTTNSKPGLVDGAQVRTKFHTTNLRGATLQIDSTTAQPIQITPGGVIPAGVLQANAPISLVYSIAFAAWLCVGVVQPAFTTGDAKLTFKTVADPGWLMAADQSIGNTGSGATFADPSAQDLFVTMWNGASNTDAPVSGGRGATGLADWNAGKTLTLTKQLGRAIAIAGSGAGLTARNLGDAVGEEAHLLVIGEIPSHTHGATQAAHSHNIGEAETEDAGNQPLVGGAAAGVHTAVTDSQAPAITVQHTGNDGAHNNMQPTTFFNVMIKL